MKFVFSVNSRRRNFRCCALSQQRCQLEETGRTLTMKLTWTPNIFSLKKTIIRQKIIRPRPPYEGHAPCPTTIKAHYGRPTTRPRCGLNLDTIPKTGREQVTWWRVKNGWNIFGVLVWPRPSFRILRRFIRVWVRHLHSWRHLSWCRPCTRSARPRPPPLRASTWSPAMAEWPTGTASRCTARK